MRIAFLSFIFISFIQPGSLVRTKVNDVISIKIPESFTPVPQGQIINKQIHFRQPIAMYTDQENRVDLSFNQNPTRWREQDMPILKDFYKSNIMSLYDDVEFFKEELIDIRGRKFAVFEFISTVKGDPNSIRNNSGLRRYTYIEYTVYNGTTLIANLSAPASYRSSWSKTAEEIMNSIALK